MPVIVTDDPVATRRFYEEFLGFDVVMEEDGFLMFSSPSVATTQVIVVWRSPTALDPAARQLTMSLEVRDVDAAYADARRRDLEIVHPLTDEPWGIRRFFVREPSGAVINVASHIADLPAGEESSAVNPPLPKLDQETIISTVVDQG
jgi:catechol 2,3-dioxygenase-like lactoylglutathione lyase family enzyme